jgi:guanylate kinase
MSIPGGKQTQEIENRLKLAKEATGLGANFIVRYILNRHLDAAVKELVAFYDGTKTKGAKK